MSYKATKRPPPEILDPACSHDFRHEKNDVEWIKKYDQHGNLIVDPYGRPIIKQKYWIIYKCDKCGQKEKTPG
jgi:hypothetical protein